MRTIRTTLRRAALVAVCAVVPFLPALRAPFLFDDYNTVVQNPAIHAINLDAFFSDPTTFSVKPGNWPYRPLTTALNAIAYQLAGARPPLWHGLQILLHLINSILVMLVAEQAFGLRRGALIAGLIFACAPIQVQAVAYVSARSMVAAAGPALFAVLALARAGKSASERGKLRWTVAAIIACGPAFFSSEGSLALGGWLAIAWYVSGRGLSDRWARYILAGAGAMSLAYLAARFAASPGALLAAHARVMPSYTRLESVSLQLMYPFAIVKLLLFPAGLNFLHHPRAAASLWDPRLLLPAAGLVGLAVVIWRRRREGALAGGLAWYLGSLLPAVIVPLNIAWAEHRAYLALPGLAVAAGYILERMTGEAAERGRVQNRIAAVCLGLVVVLWSAGSWRRCEVWQSERAMFRDTVRKSPDYDVPWNFLADEARQRLEYQKALGYLDRAIGLNADFADAYSARAAVLMELGRLPEAEQAARRAVELDPANPTYWNNYAMAVIGQGRLAEAEPILLEAIRRMPAQDPNRAIFERNLERLREDLRRGGM